VYIMKRITSMFALFPLVLLLVPACNEDDTARQIMLEDYVQVDLSSESNSFSDRKTVDIFSYSKGTVQAITLGADHPLYVISPEVKSKYMFNNYIGPYNLPPSLYKDDLEIIFSGNLKEVLETENVFAPFFELTEVWVKR